MPIGTQNSGGNQDPFNTGVPFGGFPAILTQVSDFATALAPKILPALSLLAPGALDNPEVQFLFQSGLGNELSNELGGMLPTLRTLPSSFGDVTLPGGDNVGVGILSATQQALNERGDIFEQLQNQAADQEAARGVFRTRVNEGLAGLDTVDLALRKAGLENNAQLRLGLQSVQKTRTETLNLMAGGLRTLQNLVTEVKAGNKEVLDSIEVDVASRAEQLRVGIESRNRSTFNLLESQMDSVAPLSEDDRAILRSMEDLQTGSDMAAGMGQLHAVAVEFKGEVSRDLQVSLNSVVGVVGNAGSQLIGNTQASVANLERASIDLRRSYLDNNRSLAVARSELGMFGAEFRRKTGLAEFDMASEMVRPVAVYSDILFDSYGIMADSFAFNNQVDLNQLMINAQALDPRFSFPINGITSAAGVLSNKAATNAAKQAQQDELINFGIQAGTTILTAGLGDSLGAGLNGLFSTTGGALPSLGGTAFPSDENIKHDIEKIDDKEVLSRFDALPVKSWKYNGSEETHVGPMAQDFQKAFGLGNGRRIPVVDAVGVLMSAVKALSEEVQMLREGSK